MLRTLHHFSYLIILTVPHHFSNRNTLSNCHFQHTVYGIFVTFFNKKMQNIPANNMKLPAGIPYWEIKFIFFNFLLDKEQQHILYAKTYKPQYITLIYDFVCIKYQVYDNENFHFLSKLPSFQKNMSYRYTEYSKKSIMK